MSTNTVAAPKPKKPWRPTPKALIPTYLGILATILGTWILIEFTGLAGKLGAFASAVFLTTLISSLVAGLQRGKQAAKNAAVAAIITSGALVAVFPVVSILGTVIVRGVKGIYLGFFTTDMGLASVNDPLNVGGILHAIVGTALMIVIATFVSVPLGISTAIYLTEIKGPGTRLIRFLIQAMSGVPSIVAGLFIYSALISGSGRGFNGLFGAFALAILMLPTVARTAEEVLLLIAQDLREAGLALGATQWRTVAMVVVPAARSGLITAVILGVARIAGETAPLLFTTGGGDVTNLNPVDGVMGSIPFAIWKALISGSEESNARAWASILVLLVLVMVLFFSARRLGKVRR
ncbi:MAG: phosphate ABC transporter permease PstA [Actinomycetota bacterium]